VAPKSGSGEIWTNLPSLDTLEVAGYLTRHIDHLPSLSITSLRAYKQISHYSEDDLFNLIPKLAPRLEFLSLPRGIKYLTSGIYAVARAGGPPGFSLYELSFSGPFRWLQWVLSSTKNTLTILDLHDSLREDQFEAILSAHGATLLSLRLSNAEEPLTDEASISLSHCIRLQEFRYLHLPSEATLDHLPLSTLEHLDLTLDLKKIKNTGLIALANWMKKSKLFIFTWNWQDSPKGHTCPGINRTIEVCIESGIELRCFMPPIGAWIGERYVSTLTYLYTLSAANRLSSEELEYAYIFPRPCYTSNQRRDLWSQVQSLSVSWEPSWV